MNSPSDGDSGSAANTGPRRHRISFLTLLIGLTLIASAWYGYRHMGRFLETAQEASAIVVEIVYESANKKGRMHPVVRFTTAEGREVTVRSDEHHNVRPGQAVRVIYDPAHPEQIEIATLSRAQNRRLLFTGGSLLLGLYVCFLGMGLKLRK